MKKTLILLSLLFVTLSCKKIDTIDDTPACIKDKIRELLKEDCPSVKEVNRYDYQGIQVYEFVPKDCGADLTTEVYTSDCELYCSLGGFAGNTSCHGGFFSDATNKTKVWSE